jgi:hypothetical protein
MRASSSPLLWEPTLLRAGVQFANHGDWRGILPAIAIARLAGAQVSGGTKAFESSMYSSAPTSFRTSRTGIGNRRRVGSCTTAGAKSWYFLPKF